MSIISRKWKYGDDCLTNINCSENCIYQHDGKCCFENICEQKISPHQSCAYYTEVPFNCSMIQESDKSNNINKS